MGMLRFEHQECGCCDDHEEENGAEEYVDAALGLFVLPFIPNSRALLRQK